MMAEGAVGDDAARLVVERKSGLMRKPTTSSAASEEGPTSVQLMLNSRSRRRRRSGDGGHVFSLGTGLGFAALVVPATQHCFRSLRRLKLRR